MVSGVFIQAYCTIHLLQNPCYRIKLSFSTLVYAHLISMIVTREKIALDVSEFILVLMS